MQNREFEKKVQDKMEGLKLAPSDAVWDKVEASLPEEKKRRWVIFMLLFAALLTGSLWLWNSNNTTVNKKDMAAATAPANDTSDTTTIKPIETTQQAGGNGSVISKKETVDKKDSGQIAIVPSTKNFTTTSSQKIKIKNADIGVQNNLDDVVQIAKNQKKLRSKTATRVKVKSPDPENAVEEKNAEVIRDGEAETNVSKTNDILTAAADSAIATTKKIPTDTAVTFKKDSLVTTVAKKEPPKQNRAQRKYGIELAGGLAADKAGFFSAGNIYTDAAASSISSSPGGTSIVAAPNKPQAGFAFDIGICAEKMIDKRWSFKTGLHFLYQSTTIKVGSKVDSVANFSFDVNKNISASNYYRAGNTHTYLNRFFVLELPLLFQYKFASHLPVYVEGGPSIAWLLHSNALVYSKQSASYFTDKGIFNKLLYSVSAGVAVDLAQKTKLPFTIGYRFKYNVNSVTKITLSEQHLTSSMLYLKIPLKK